jgi:hypothetical protein
VDFSQAAGAESPSSLIPKGALLWVIVSMRGEKDSKTGGRYLDLELTVDDGQPYARKKLWEMVGHPFHGGNSDGYKTMGMVAVTRMLECGNNASPNNPAGYQIPDFSHLDGKRVAVKIGVDKGEPGYSDKNRVAEWLTPNPESKSGNKDFVRLMAGDHGISAEKAPPVQSSFGFPAAGQPQQNFQQPAAGQPQPQQSQPAQAAERWGSGGAPSAGPASMTKSPSSAAPPAPGWLTQGQ